jgi:hypothetical protein
MLLTDINIVYNTNQRNPLTGRPYLDKPPFGFETEDIGVETLVCFVVIHASVFIHLHL